MKLTMLNFSYCNLADLGEKFGIEIPEQDTPEFFNLNDAVMQVLSTDLKIRSGNNKFDWENPLGPKSTEFQKAEAFQNCIRIMREHEVFSHNKILNEASRIQSVDIIDTRIPPNAKPEEIKETLKKTIEAVVASLEGHKKGVLAFKRKTGKSEAIDELVSLRKLANSEAIDLGELKKSLGIMEKFQGDPAKYGDYQSNLSILKRLASSIEEHNSSKKPAKKVRFALTEDGPETEEEPLSLELEETRPGSSLSVKPVRQLSRNQEGTSANRQAPGEPSFSRKVLSPGQRTTEFPPIKGAGRSSLVSPIHTHQPTTAEEEERQLKLAIQLSLKKAEKSPAASLLKERIEEINLRSSNHIRRNAQDAQPAAEDDGGLAKAIEESLKHQARASKEQPYNLDQIKSALGVYKKRAEGAHLISVQFSDEQITSEKLLRESLRDYESPSEGIFVGQLKSIKLEGFLKDKEKEIFLCPYLDGTTAGQDSHWKLLQFKKDKGKKGQNVIRMTTIDPLGVEHSTKEWPSLIEAMKTAANECGCKFGFFTENGQKIKVQTRGNNTECGPAICYIMDQIARGVDIQDIETPKNLETLRKEQGQVTALSHVDRLAARNSGAGGRSINL